MGEPGIEERVAILETRVGYLEQRAAATQAKEFFIIQSLIAVAAVVLALVVVVLRYH